MTESGPRVRLLRVVSRSVRTRRNYLRCSGVHQVCRSPHRGTHAPVPRSCSRYIHTTYDMTESTHLYSSSLRLSRTPSVNRKLDVTHTLNTGARMCEHAMRASIAIAQPDATRRVHATRSTQVYQSRRSHEPMVVTK